MCLCKHIIITSDIKIEKEQIKTDEIEFKCFDTYFCVKCGQSMEFLTIEYEKNEEEIVSSIEDYNCICDRDLAVAIYNCIINKFPEIDDKTALKYLKASINNMRTKQKTDNVQKQRIKRLGLHPNFNRWQIKDIIEN